MRDTFLIFGQPLMEEPVKDEVQAVKMSGWLGTGPRVAQFEKAFSEYKGMPFAAALYSCTAGLHLACLDPGLGNGDEVITSA